MDSKPRRQSESPAPGLSGGLKLFKASSTSCRAEAIPALICYKRTTALLRIGGSSLTHHPQTGTVWNQNVLMREHS
jgi:hypothetical protein